MRARIRSIDLLRGASVLLMLFVNEVRFVRGAPGFLRHKGAGDDGMTVTDLVFPSFLFVVGMLIPFALGARLRGGHSRLAVLGHVATRAAALIVIGVLMVNAEHGVPGPLSVPVWNLVMTLGVLMVWALPSAGWAARRGLWLRAAGVVLLLFTALVFRGEGASGWLQLRLSWWGILGQIGWAYLGVASLYLVVGARPAILTGLIGLYGCIALAGAAGGLGWPTIRGPIMGPILGTHGAVVLAGTLVGALLLRERERGAVPARFALQALGCAAALAAAGLLLHTLAGVQRAFTISKIYATLPWGLVSAALACSAWVLVFLVGDVRGWTRWPPAVVIAGENPLLAYLLAPLLLSLFELSAPLFGGVDPYRALGASTGVGLLSAAVFAWLVVRLAGVLRSRGLRIQL